MVLENRFIEDLHIALKGDLPGKKSHSKMVPPHRELDVQPEQLQKVKKSSVLILLYPYEGKLCCCLIKRPKTMKHHPGQIAFPGGKVDKTDPNELATALREANEEVGLKSDEIKVVGDLSNLYVSVSNFLIHPYIAWSETKPDFIMNPAEVELIIDFPILDCLYQAKFDTTQLKTPTGILEVPCIFYNGETIWGATAMILSELLDVIRNFWVQEELHWRSAGNY